MSKAELLSALDRCRDVATEEQLVLGRWARQPGVGDRRAAACKATMARVTATKALERIDRLRESAQRLATRQVHRRPTAAHEEQLSAAITGVRFRGSLCPLAMPTCTFELAMGIPPRNAELIAHLAATVYSHCTKHRPARPTPASAPPSSATPRRSGRRGG